MVKTPTFIALKGRYYTAGLHAWELKLEYNFFEVKGNLRNIVNCLLLEDALGHCQGFTTVPHNF